ncbi:MAG: hypothetical protein CM15mP49_05080 [Actinomycetota bacterium]|nr:MAG: hypothetical protein CM15mP49_05080 [Actinomycetota bacterium]
MLTSSIPFADSLAARMVVEGFEAILWQFRAWVSSFSGEEPHIQIHSLLAPPLLLLSTYKAFAGLFAVVQGVLSVLEHLMPIIDFWKSKLSAFSRYN